MIVGGLDIGTSNCKLSIYEDGSLIAQATGSYATIRDDGRHLLDADGVWNTVKGLFHRAIAENPRAAEVRAMAVSALGEAAAPLDAAGNTLGKALLFWDASGKEEMDSLVRKVGKENIQAITGVIPHPMYTLCKIAWQKKHLPAYSRAKYFMLFEDFIIYRLTGERFISYSLAGRTMGLDLKTGGWSRVLFDAAGVDPALMSKPSASGTPAGTVLPSIAAELGLRAKPLIVVGGHDQMCVAVGAGALREGVASNGSGTVEVLAVTLPGGMPPEPLYKDNYTVSIHADPAKRFTYSCNSTGGILLSWYVNAFGDGNGEAAFADFESKAPRLPTSLTMLPYVAGTGTPYMDFDARGAICGLGMETTKYDIYRSLMEGLTFDLVCNMENLRAAGVSLREIRSTGGGSLSKMWLQIKADMTGLPVHTLQSHQAGAMGCMILAATAAGAYKSIYEAADDLVRIKDRYVPDAANHRIYMEKKERFLEIFKGVRGAELRTPQG